MDELRAPVGIKPHKIENPEKTFFFERYDGSIINVKEFEAWNLLKGRQAVLGKHIQPPKLIGVSDGSRYYLAVQEAHTLYAAGNVEAALDRLRLGEKEELEAARGNVEMPRNFDTIDQNRQPVSFGIGGIKRQ